MSSSVSSQSPSGIGPEVVATSSSTVSKWCAVIVGHGPCRWITLEDPLVLVVGVDALEDPGRRHRAERVVHLLASFTSLAPPASHRERVGGTIRECDIDL